VNDHHPIVGAWRVAVEVGGSAGPTNLATFGADGTVVVVFPSPTAAAPEAGHRLEYWTPALGAWADDGGQGADLQFVALGADETGAVIGTHTVIAEVTVGADRTSWQGRFRLDVAGPAGALRASVAGTVSATRIAALTPEAR
jgi:hypothetical protein